MLGRFKNLVVVLGLLVLPVSSTLSMLGRFKNPVVALELSKRYKSKAYAMVVHPVYAVYAVYAFLVLAYAVAEREKFHPQVDFDALLGLTALPVFGMILLVVPVLSAVSVAGERRRGTLMLVQLSSLRPFDIVWGKVVASIAPVLFPVVACMVAVCSFSLSSLMLDMDRENVYRLFGSVVVGAGLVVLSVAVSVVCVLCSTFAKSSASAITMIYGLFLSMVFVLPALEELPLASRLVPGAMIQVLLFGALSAWMVGLPFWFLWACRRLRLPAEK